MAENTLIELDSLSANEFKVELDGQEVQGVFRVSGFKPFDFVNTGNSHSVILTRMVQRDANNPFNKWVRESVSTLGMDVNPTRSLAIVFVDEEVEIRRYTLNGAYLVGLSYSDLDTSRTELVEEITTIQYASVEVKWTATASLE